MEKYRLAMVEVKTQSSVEPLDEEGRHVGGRLVQFENNDDYYYAIYENMGTESDPCWSEYDYFEQDLDRAKDAYKKLIRGETEHMKKYELTVLGIPDETDTEDKVKRVIERLGIRIDKVENGGRKRLAYDINGHGYATYYYFDLTMPEGMAVKLSTTLNIKDYVLRYLLVRKDF